MEDNQDQTTAPVETPTLDSLTLAVKFLASKIGPGALAHVDDLLKG